MPAVARPGPPETATGASGCAPSTSRCRGTVEFPDGVDRISNSPTPLLAPTDPAPRPVGRLGMRSRASLAAWRGAGRRRFEREREHLLGGVDERDPERAADLGQHVLQVGLVPARQDDRREPGPERRQRLLLDRAGSSTSSSAAAGSPWNPAESLSTSSSIMTGSSASARRIAWMIRPGIAPRYVRRWPRISASSCTPPRLSRTKRRPIARAIDWPTEVFPTPGGPTRHRIGSRSSLASAAAVSPSPDGAARRSARSLRTARCSRSRSFTRSRSKWSASRTARASARSIRPPEVRPHGSERIQSSHVRTMPYSGDAGVMRSSRESSRSASRRASAETAGATRDRRSPVGPTSRRRPWRTTRRRAPRGGAARGGA